MSPAMCPTGFSPELGKAHHHHYVSNHVLLNLRMMRTWELKLTVYEICHVLGPDFKKELQVQAHEREQDCKEISG